MQRSLQGRIRPDKGGARHATPLRGDAARPGLTTGRGARTKGGTSEQRAAPDPAEAKRPPWGEARPGNGPGDRFRAERAEPPGGRCPARRRAGRFGGDTPLSADKAWPNFPGQRTARKAASGPHRGRAPLTPQWGGRPGPVSRPGGGARTKGGTSRKRAAPGPAEAKRPPWGEARFGNGPGDRFRSGPHPRRLTISAAAAFPSSPPSRRSVARPSRW